MKRGIVFLILFAVLIIPAVSATISITGPSKAQYNLGEEIDISGYVQETNDFSGEIQVSLICASKTYKLPAIDIDISAGQKVSFDILSLSELTATSSMLGICKQKVELLVGKVTTESTTSTFFEITRDLEGSFSVDQTQVQLGDTIVLSGTVTKLNGNPIDGTAEIYFETNGEEYLIDFVELESGTFVYSYKFPSGEAGAYKINVLVRDSYGNEQNFKNVESFTVLSDLRVILETNVEILSPGDVLNIFGEVKTALQDYVKTAIVEITLDGDTQSTALADSKFTHDLDISSTITSGTHIITVYVEDSYGNSGSTSVSFDIEALGSRIETRISSGTLDPLNQVNIGVTLYDQADEVMTGLVSFTVYDSNNRIVSETQIASEDSITYKIPQFAPPGEWVIKTYYLNPETQKELISQTETIFINEVQELEYYISGNVLYITNTGNVKYTEGVEIPVSGLDEQYLITRARNLGVNETISIDLSQELPSGTYKVSIPTGFNTASDDEITVTNGKIKTTLTWPYLIVVVLIIIALISLVYAKLKPKHRKKEKSKEISPGDIPSQKSAIKDQPKKIRLYDPKREATKGKKVSVTFEDKQHSLEDFKQRTLEEIKRTEEKIQKDSRRGVSLSDGKLGYVTGRNDPVSKPKSAQEKPSVFNLFDE